MEKYARTTTMLVVAGLLLASGLGYYFASVTARAPAAQQQKSGVYRLTLVEIMDVAWNSTTMQPKFYVLGDHGLESSANISLPVNTLIQVTVFSYDTPTGGVSSQEAKVQGTVGGAMAFYNGTLATGIDNETMAQMMSIGENVTSVPVDSVAHTFTVPQLGINLPVVGGSTEIAYLRFDQAGTFTWVCLTPCGFGPDSAEGAMSAPGWMTGTITVS